MDGTCANPETNQNEEVDLSTVWTIAAVIGVILIVTIGIPVFIHVTSGN